MSNALTESVTFRLTPGEKAALDILAKRRAGELAERGDVPDDSFTGYLRALIRGQAKNAGIPVDRPETPEAFAAEMIRRMEQVSDDERRELAQELRRRWPEEVRAALRGRPPR